MKTIIWRTLIALSAVWPFAAAAIVKHQVLPFGLLLCPDEIHGIPLDQRLQVELGNPSFKTVVKLYNTSIGAQDLWSGTLISREWVLTCAHTLQGTDGQGGGIVAGDVAVEIEGHDLVFADSFVVHPNWTLNGYQQGNDIALVKLESAVTNVTVFPRLSASLPNLPVHTIFIGYGKVGTGDTGWQNGTQGDKQIGVNWPWARIRMIPNPYFNYSSPRTTMD